MTTMNVTQQLAEYALQLRYQDIPKEVITRTKELFLDFLGVGLAGHQVAESSNPIIDGVRELTRDGQGNCTVMAEPNLYPPHYAALLNGTLAHSMDFDDTHRESIMHPGSPLFATLMALAEDTGASGQEFLAAAVVGYDVGCKVGKAHSNSIHHRGFHPSATTGIFASTAAGARLMKLDAEELNNALGLNISQAAGSQQFLVNGAWNKRFHVGLAAHNAIYSLVMARHGYLGATEPIEGKFGYFALYCSEPRDATRALLGLGSDFEVMHTAIKPYPCCRYSHAAIDAVVALAREESLTPSNIAGIEIEMSETGFYIVASPEKQKKMVNNIVDGQFSIYFAAAVSAAHREYTWDSYNYIDTPDIRKIMELTTVRPVSDLSEMASRVFVTTRGGQRLEREVLLPRGEPENPLSWQEIETKFTDLAHGVIGLDETRIIIEKVGALESMASFSNLSKHLKP